MSDKTQKNNILFSEYVLKKVEKISNALYIITSFFPENEPLRVSIREKTLSILSDISILRTRKTHDNITFVAHISDHISELMTLLSVGHSARLISSMNFHILEQELNNVASLGGGSSGPVFDNTYFHSEALPEAKSVLAKPLSRPLSSSPSTAPTASSQPVTTRKKIEKKERNEHILDILAAQGKSTIKDIAKHIPGYSTKTIQRALQSLIDKGLVAKEGDRRWTQYFLVN